MMSTLALSERLSTSLLADPSLFVLGSTLIAGSWVSAKAAQTFEVKSPATDNVIGWLPECGLEDLEHAIQAASEALQDWKRRPGRHRGQILRKIRNFLVENQQDLATIITLENGKARADAIGEVL